MGFEEIWNEYTSSEKDMFQKSVRRLLKQTFIVRDRDEDSKKAYYFVSKRSEPFSAYLGYIGYDIVIDRENGVIMLQNCRDLGENGKLQINHVTLKRWRVWFYAASGLSMRTGCVLEIFRKILRFR